MEYHYQFKNLNFFLNEQKMVQWTQATTAHTSAVFHQNKHFINTGGNLIDSTTKVGDGILVARQKFLEHFLKTRTNDIVTCILHFQNVWFSVREESMGNDNNTMYDHN